MHRLLEGSQEIGVSKAGMEGGLRLDSGHPIDAFRDHAPGPATSTARRDRGPSGSVQREDVTLFAEVDRARQRWGGQTA